MDYRAAFSSMGKFFTGKEQFTKAFGDMVAFLVTGEDAVKAGAGDGGHSGHRYIRRYPSLMPVRSRRMPDFISAEKPSISCPGFTEIRTGYLSLASKYPSRPGYRSGGMNRPRRSRLKRTAAWKIF